MRHTEDISNYRAVPQMVFEAEYCVLDLRARDHTRNRKHYIPTCPFSVFTSRSRAYNAETIIYKVCYKNRDFLNRICSFYSRHNRLRTGLLCGNSSNRHTLFALIRIEEKEKKIG